MIHELNSPCHSERYSAKDLALNVEARSFASTLRMTMLAAMAWFACGVTLAKPTQEDVFKSIKSNVGESTDPKTLLAILAVLAGVVLVLVMLGNRRKRVVQPKSL